MGGSSSGAIRIEEVSDLPQEDHERRKQRSQVPPSKPSSQTSQGASGALGPASPSQRRGYDEEFLHEARDPRIAQTTQGSIPQIGPVPACAYSHDRARQREEARGPPAANYAFAPDQWAFSPGASPYAWPCQRDSMGRPVRTPPSAGMDGRPSSTPSPSSLGYYGSNGRCNSTGAGRGTRAASLPRLGEVVPPSPVTQQGFSAGMDFRPASTVPSKPPTITARNQVADMLECFDPTGRGLVVRQRFVRLLASVLPVGKHTKIEDLVAASGAEKGGAVDVRRFMHFLYGTSDSPTNKTKYPAQDAWMQGTSHTASASTRTPEDSCFEFAPAENGEAAPEALAVQSRATLFEMVRKQQVRLLRLDFLIDWYESSASPMPRRQDLPNGAFLHVDAMSPADRDALELVAVSAAWTHDTHADEGRHHLATIVELGRRLRSSRDAPDGQGLRPANRPIGVYWDWVSLHQAPRTPLEEGLYNQALENIAAWFLNSTVTKWLLASAQQDELSSPSRKAQPTPGASSSRTRGPKSGWRMLERQVACLATPQMQVLWISEEIRQTLLSGGAVQPGAIHEASLQYEPHGLHTYSKTATAAKASRKAPLTIELFDLEMDRCYFLNSADREKLVKPQYARAFHAAITDAAEHDFSSFALSTNETRRLLKLLEAYVQDMKIFRFADNAKHEVPFDDFVALACSKSQVLQEFCMQGCTRMGGSLQSAAALGRSLKVLNLSKTQVVGNLQDIGGAMLMTELNLSASQVEGNIGSLGMMQWLTKLDLHTSKVTGDIAVLGGMYYLQEVYLHWTAVYGDVRRLTPLKRLARLYLNDTQVSGPLQGISELVSLRDMDLSTTQVAGDISSLQPLQWLSRVRLWWTQTDGDIGHLAANVELTELDLFKTQVHGDIGHLRGLRKLRRIDLDMTNVGGDIAHLATLSVLQKVSLQATQVMGDVEHISTLPELMELDFRYTMVTGDAVTLMSLPNLQLAGITDTQVVGDRRGLELYIQRNQQRMQTAMV